MDRGNSQCADSGEKGGRNSETVKTERRRGSSGAFAFRSPQSATSQARP